MKQLIKPLTGRKLFSIFHITYSLLDRQATFFPAYAKALAGWLLPSLRYLRNFAGLALSFFLITACPDDPPDNTDCGTHQIEVNGDCECDDGYHWNEDKSKCLMDTTSHNFTWYYDQPLGSALSSAWSDVSIIEEDDIWAVGFAQLDEYDTVTGLDHSDYNAAHWDGSSWELIKVPERIDYEWGDQHYSNTGSELMNVFSFESKIWFVSTAGGLGVLTPEGWYYYEQHLYPGPSPGAIWGTDENNVYTVSYADGRISHFDGQRFRIEYPATTGLRDMWGLDDNHIWAVGCDGTNRLCQIIYYDGSYWQEIYFMDVDEWYPDNVNPDTLNGHVYAVWAFEDTVYYGTVHGLWRESVTTHKGYMVKFEDWGLDKFEIRKIRGNGYNDIFVAGHAGQVVHFNGKSWKVIHLMDSLIEIKSMAIKNDMIVLVGHDDNIVALTIRGYR